MIEFFRNLFNKPDQESVDSATHNSAITFVLKIDDIEIGRLEFKEKEWIFSYSEDFKNQTKYNRIVGFSDLNKGYRNEVLWPFFKIRIPGLKQPLIQEILQKENINIDDEASLLRKFGRTITSNPYVLEPT